MNYQELSTHLRDAAQMLREERSDALDLAALASYLTAAAEALMLAQTDRSSAQQLIGQFREELRRRARATAQLVGGDSSLIEKLIDSAEATFEDLVKLSKQLALEFDKAFASSLTESLPETTVDEKLAAYKS